MKKYRCEICNRVGAPGDGDGFQLYENGEVWHEPCLTGGVPGHWGKCSEVEDGEDDQC